MANNLIAFPGPEAHAVVTAVKPVSERVERLLAPTRTKALFSEDGDFLGTREEWRPRPVAPTDLPDLRRQLALLKDALQPAERAPLAARVFALLAHYREKDPLPPTVEAAIAEDWCDDLAEFPMWTVVEACRRWRQDPKRYRFRPHPNDLRLLCLEIVAKSFEIRERLEWLLESVGEVLNHDARQADEEPVTNAAVAADLRSRIRLLAETKRIP